MIKFIVFIITTFLAFVLQTGFFNSFSFNFNFVLSIIVFYCVIVSFENALILSLINGFLLEIFSDYNFGLVLVCLIATLFFVNFLFHYLFTNKSLYSLVTLGAIATFFYGMILGLVNNVLFFLKFADLKILMNFSFFNNMLFQIIFCSIFLGILFFIYNSLSLRLKSVFLIQD